MGNFFVETKNFSRFENFLSLSLKTFSTLSNFRLQSSSDFVSTSVSNSLAKIVINLPEMDARTPEEWSIFILYFFILTNLNRKKKKKKERVYIYAYNSLIRVIRKGEIIVYVQNPFNRNDVKSRMKYWYWPSCASTSKGIPLVWVMAPWLELQVPQK